MNIVPSNVTRTIGRGVLETKKNSPHIFFALGMAGVITSTVLACRATLKLENTIDDAKNDVDAVKVLGDQAAQDGGYSDNDYHRDMGYVFGKNALKVAKLYGPAVIVGGLSIAALTGSHIQLTKRNTALTMTLAAVSKAYDEYRIRVQDKIGEEEELRVHRGITTETELIDGKKNEFDAIDGTGFSPYARFFDEYSPNWQKDAEYNKMFLQCQENWCNQKLKARGHLFLNEVYDSLGLDRTRAGAVVGWVIGDGEDGYSDGDGYISFGMFQARNSRFINSIERSIILDFNVDGVIYDKI